MTRPVALLARLAAALTLSLPVAAAAADWRPDRMSADLVDPDVTFVTTGVVEGQRYRAIVLETRQDAVLLLEAADAWGRRRPSAQVRVATLEVGRSRVDSLNVLDFRDLRFGRAALLFETTLRQGDVRCRVPLRRFDPRDRVISAICEDLAPPRPLFPASAARPPAVSPHGHPSRHPPAVGAPPRGASWEAEIVTRCGRAAIGNQNTEACIRAARPIGPAAPDAIAACEAHAVGGAALIGCLEAVGADHPLAAELIGACANATVGPSAWHSCIRLASASRFDPVPVIRACHDASVGNDALQRCLAASLR